MDFLNASLQTRAPATHEQGGDPQVGLSSDGHIPFLPHDEACIASCGRWAQIVGGTTIVFGALELLALVASLAKGAGFGFMTLVAIALGLLAIAGGVALIRAGAQFRLVALTDGADKEHLMNGIVYASSYFNIVGVLLSFGTLMTILSLFGMVATLNRL